MENLPQATDKTRDSIAAEIVALRLEGVIAARAKERQQGGQGGVLLLQKSAEAIDTRQEIAKAADTSTGTSGRAHGDARHHHGLVIRHSRSGECQNPTSSSTGTVSTANTGANI